MTFLGFREAIFSKVLVWEVTLEDAVPKENSEDFRKYGFLPSTHGKPQGKHQPQ